MIKSQNYKITKIYKSKGYSLSTKNFSVGAVRYTLSFSTQRNFKCQTAHATFTAWFLRQRSKISQKLPHANFGKKIRKKQLFFVVLGRIDTFGLKKCWRKHTNQRNFKNEITKICCLMVIIFFVIKSFFVHKF